MALLHLTPTFFSASSLTNHLPVLYTLANLGYLLLPDSQTGAHHLLKLSPQHRTCPLILVCENPIHPLRKTQILPPAILARLSFDRAWIVYFPAIYSLVYNVLLFEYLS